MKISSRLKPFFTLSVLITLLFPQIALAQSTLLPQGNESTVEDCNTFFDSTHQVRSTFTDYDQETRENILACAIKTGRINLWMLPYFISYFANFFIGIAGTVSVLFVLLGGFWYMVGGVNDDKEKGKKTILYALVGMVITLLAWIIVNVVQVAVTG